MVWSSNSIPRFSLILWLLVLDRLPTRDKLLNWGVVTTPSCLLCSANLESSDHLFFKCPLSSSVWFRVRKALSDQQKLRLFIRKERNHRLWTGHQNSPDYIFSSIFEAVRVKA
uniref:Reverse transcriptase zinc-binding domain-containing protein n=1 Tax=Davidia involucrata TaxID=16924 RepID=A0A5B6ZUN8_DAVIN